VGPNGLLPRLRFIEQVADHDEASRDADPCRQYLSLRRFYVRNGVCDGEPGPHCPLGLVLVRPRPAEIGEHAVTPEVRNMPLEATDLSCHCVLVGPYELTQRLRIEPPAEFGRTNEVNEHHGQLPPLGLGCPLGDRLGRWFKRRRIITCWLRLPPQRPDRVEQPALVPDRGHTDRSEVVRTQPRQDLCVDIIVAKGLRVPL
jgi:hypothetical protein